MYNYRNFKNMFWCQKVLPLVYDDSLSYYEVLCKVFGYLNHIIDDLKILTDLKEYIKQALEEYLNDGTIDELLKEIVANQIEDAYKYTDKQIRKYSHNTPFIAQRAFRLERTMDKLCAQSIASTDNSIIFIGTKSADDSVQNIVETTIDGTIIRDVQITTGIGHCNGSAYLNGKLYVVDGSASSDNISVLNYSTLAVERTQALTPHPYAMCEYEGDIYCLTADASYTRIQKFNTTSWTFTEMCHFLLPQPLNTNSNVTQDFAILDGVAYCVRNGDNAIFRIDLETGEILGCIDLPDGDGFYPFGEIESLTLFDGQLWLSSDLRQSGTYAQYSFIQLFKTNLGGYALPSGHERLDITKYNIAYVDYGSTANNPTGTSGSPFHSIEEFAVIYPYLSNRAFSGFSQVNVRGKCPTAMDTGVFESGALYFDMSGGDSSNLYRLYLYNGNWYVYAGNYERIVPWNSQCTLWDVNIENLLTADASNILIAGGTVHELNASGCTIEQSGNAVIQGFGRWNRCYSNSISR